LPDSTSAATEQDAFFAAAGPLARSLPDYRVRFEQIEMSRAVHHAIKQGQTVVLEAGTGVGKTAAYLVPALTQGGKVIISTGTKALQDQLFNRDLPAIQQALAIPVKTALLKGRGNYVCWHHLARTNQDASLLGNMQEVRDLGHINRYIPISPTGDKAECAAVPENASIWSRVTSTRENCLGSDCEDHHRCFVLQARREAQDADIVVINHHIFFADLMLREEGIQELLPSAQTLIFDEAHQLPDTATLFFGQVVSSLQLLDLLRDIKAFTLTQARDAAPWGALIGACEIAVKDIRLCFSSGPSKWSQPQINSQHGLWAARQHLLASLSTLREALASPDAHAALSSAEVQRELSALHRRAEEKCAALSAWGSDTTKDAPELCWLDISQMHWHMHRTPISVADLFRRQRLGEATQEDGHALPAMSDKAWIFTSATLAVKQDFSLFQASLGLQDATCQSWSSPYDYGEQALLYVPHNLPMPQSSGYGEALIKAALPLITANEGHAFLLCTSLRAVEQLSRLLREQIEADKLPLRVLSQGEAPRPMLLDEFRRIGHAVLVGSHSFWEGIDVKGNALSLVIIDKLPFAPPDDPILARRLELLAQEGGNPFMDYQLPQAIIALKQGAGRLIRSESDQGVLMIADPRLVDKPYGKRIWQSMPPMARTRVQQEAIDFLLRVKTVPL